MFKFNLKLDFTSKELLDAIEPNLRAAVGITAGRVYQRANETAASTLKKGLSQWKKGLDFDTHLVSSGVWILSLNGKMANWMEDGFSSEELKRAIMSGTRATANYAEALNKVHVGKFGGRYKLSSSGKKYYLKEGEPRKYVDVPIKSSGSSFIRALEQTKLEIGNVKSGDQIVATFSNWKRGGVIKEKRIVQRAKDIIKSKNLQGTDTQFLTIRRMTEASNWKGYRGAKVFDSLDSFIQKAFEQSLKYSL